MLTAWAMAMLCDRMRWGAETDLSRLARKGPSSSPALPSAS